MERVYCACGCVGDHDCPIDRAGGKLKVYLDDVRMPPSREWVLVSTPEQFREIMCCLPDEISMDHDLGGEVTGYDLLLEVIALGWEGPIHFHSMNPVGLARMKAAWSEHKLRDGF